MMSDFQIVRMRTICHRRPPLGKSPADHISPRMSIHIVCTGCGHRGFISPRRAAGAKLRCSACGQLQLYDASSITERRSITARKTQTEAFESPATSNFHDDSVADMWWAR